MAHPLHIAIVGASGLAVAIGDGLIKKAGNTAPNFNAAVVHPLMGVALCLYAVQVVLFLYVFMRRWELAIVCLLQMAVYAGVCVLMGRFLFGERITWQQGLGMLLTFCGAALMIVRF